MIDTNNIYQSALNYTIIKRYGFKISKKTLKRFKIKNSDLVEIFDYLDAHLDKNNKTKKDFLKILNSYLSPFNRLFRTFRF